MRKILILFFALITSFANAQLSGVDDASYNTTDLGYGTGANAFAHLIIPQATGKLIVGYQGGVYRFNDDGTTRDSAFNEWESPATPINYLLRSQQPDSSLIIRKNSWFNYFSLFRTDKNGVYDSSFDSTLAFNEDISTVAYQSDGKIIVGGIFITAGTDTVFRIARLHPNGQLDLTFNSGTAFDSITISSIQVGVRTLAVDSLDRILVGGVLLRYNGQLVPNLIRLLPDGTLDTTFNYFTPNNGTPNVIVIQNNNKILVAGGFNSGGYRMLVRLNFDGSIDTTFNNLLSANNSGEITRLHLMNDGRILIATKNNSTINGAPAYGLVMFSQNGIIDTTFVSRKFNTNSFNCLTSDSLGRMIVGGGFFIYGDAGKVGMVRILSDGTPDYNFNYGYGFNYYSVSDIAMQPDGKHIVVGGFSAHNNFTTLGIARINNDGTTDTSFRFWGNYMNTLNFTAFGFVEVLPNGNILASDYNAKLIRLFPNGSIDSSFSSAAGFVSFGPFEVMPDGKIVAICRSGGNYEYTIIRMFPDGSRDLSFNMGTFTERPKQFAFQSDGKVLVVGATLDYTFNGSPQNHTNIIRIDTSGNIDQSFVPAGFAANGINTVNVLSNGKILLGSNAGLQGSAGSVIRILANGSIDNTWNLGVFGSVRSVLIQPDGKMLVGGVGGCNFGNPCGNITRLSPNGGDDLAFWTSSGSGYTNPFSVYYVNAMAFQSDWRAVVVGQFTSYNGRGRNFINRIMLSDTVCGLPPSGIQLSITGNTICNGDSITLYRTGGSLPPGGLYRWYSGSCGTNLLGTGDSITIAPSSTGYIFVRAEGACGNTICANTFINVLAFPNPVPGGDTLLCVGESTVLGLTPNYNSYIWSNGSTASTINVVNTGTYTVTVTNNNGCSRSIEWNVGVYPYPTVSITAGGPVSFCRGGSVTLSSNPGLSNWQWYRYGVPYGSNTEDLTVWAAGIYHCIGSNIAGCADTSNTIQVTVPCMPVDPSPDKQNTISTHFTTHPNPVSGILYVHSPPGYITIFNAHGARLYEKYHASSDSEIDLSHYADGMYMIRLQTEMGVEVRRVLVERR